MQSGKRLLPVAFSLMAALASPAQQKKPAAAAPSPALAAAANLCANPYTASYAPGWPEVPVYILYHHQDSTGPWVRNPAIAAPGLEASSPAGARTLVCVEESREEKGEYDDGTKAYQAHWKIIVVDLASRGTWSALMAPNFDGDVPPFLKEHSGPGVGKLPVQPLVRYLRLLTGQKVARFRMRLDWPSEVSGSIDYDEASAMAVSGDGSKLVAARRSRSGNASPVVVFDLASGKPLSTFRVDYPVDHLAVSPSGNLIATEGAFSHGIDILDGATGNPVHKIDASSVNSLLFGPDGTLAVSDGRTVALWDAAVSRLIRTVPAEQAVVSSAGAWMVAVRSAGALTISEIDSGRKVASYTGVPSGPQTKYALSGDGVTLVAGAQLFTASGAQPRNIEFPSLTFEDSDSYGVSEAVAATRNGVAFAHNGFVGVATGANPQPRFFANGNSYIRNMAASPQGDLLVLADIEGDLSLWELE